eukprot:CCRYP_009953-RA/>CCRYP_009953-RA protein AED:0.27 eAED:-0.42 QI:0/0/0/0.5/1/1/2/0/295
MQYLKDVAFGIGLFTIILTLFVGAESRSTNERDQLLHNASLKQGMLERDDPDRILMHKSKKVHTLVFQTNSWKEMDAQEGDSMILACNAKPRRNKIYLERTYVTSGVTKSIKMCPPCMYKESSGDVLFKNGVSMSKDDSGRQYSLSGYLLLNAKDEVCDDDSDCADGLFCNERNACEVLPTGSCLLERGDRDCLISKDPLMTKCYNTEGLFALCSCDNDPSKASCVNTTLTCDFPCQIGDAVPSCDSPQSRNAFCAEFTGIETSECPPGGSSSQICTRPPTVSPTREPTTERPTR